MVILFLLLLACGSLASAATTTIPYTTITPAIFRGTEQIDFLMGHLGIGAVAFIFFAIIRYYFAIAFSDEAGVARVKAEIFDAIAVALMVGGIVVLLQITEYVAQLAYPAYFSSGPEGFFMGYILPSLYTPMDTLMKLAAHYSASANAKANNLLFSISIFGVPVVNGPWQQIGVYKEINTLLFRAELASSVAIGLGVAVAAINYIRDGAMYFLVLGLIARLFPPFRGVGAFLVSLSIGFYYIYPLTSAMFLFGIPRISLDEKQTFDLQQYFCLCKATSGIIQGSQDVGGITLELGNPQTLKEDYIPLVNTTFILSQLVALSLTATFISNATLILGRGLYTSVSIQNLLSRLI